MKTPSGRDQLSISLWLVALAHLLTACSASTTPDPRSRIKADDRNVPAIAKSVNGSELWQAYFDAKSPGGSSPLVELALSMERKTLRSSGGDYSPGKVKFLFRVKNLENRKTLFEYGTDIDLESFIVGAFPKDASREEIQDIAYQATEKKIYPYLDRWVNIAAIRAMAQQGKSGTAFIQVLEKQAEDPWSEELTIEAEKALKAIQG